MRELINEGLSKNASDIHLEPFGQRMRIRFRIDGELVEEGWISGTMVLSVINRIKVLSKMNLGENRIPQDGSCHVHEGALSCDFRVSVIPSIYGETAVIRILRKKQDFIENNNLGMTRFQKTLFLRKLREGRGLILVTGPTGSGKTSTLYAALKIVNTISQSVISMEDPVEYEIPGITQVEVNTGAGMTFDKGLRAMVRQDPDVIMIGEIRDRKTAEMAIHSALTGHLVLSTLHTTEAAKAPLRLMDMGIPPYLIAASLSLVISQRLIKKPCPLCNKITESVASESMGNPGCEYCGYTGFHGRTGIFEMMEISDPERQAIMARDEIQLKEEMKAKGEPTLSEMYDRKKEEWGLY